MKQNKDEWKLIKGCAVSKKPVLPGVWLRKDGGHLVRARAKEGTTGKLKEIFKVMPDADAATASKWLTAERARVREGEVLSSESEAALLRIRRAALRAQGEGAGDQEREEP